MLHVGTALRAFVLLSQEAESEGRRE
jgi:hypothetical protein